MQTGEQELLHIVKSACKRTTLVLTIASYSLLFSACTPPIETFDRADYLAPRLTLLSTNRHLPIMNRGERVEGKSCQNYLFAMFPISFGARIGNISEAIDNALKGKSEELVVDGSVSEYFWFVPGIWAQHCYKLEGQAARAAFRLELIQEDTIDPNVRR